MNDDNHQSVVTRESNNEERKGERVIKKYLSDLIKTNEHIDKALLISVIEHYVFKNTEIFTRLGIMMHLMVMHCVDDNLELPDNFIDHKFIDQVTKWDGWRGQLFPLVAWVIEGYNHLLVPHVPLGKTWLVGYIVRMFHGNAITSIKGKWSAVVKDSIDAFARVVLRQDPTLSDQQIERIKKEVQRQIYSPSSQRPNTAPDLQPDALELVQFHRQGFCCAEGVPLNKWYIANAEKQGLYHHFVLHYGHCLRRQESLENAWNANHLPAEQIGLKKRMPLPFYKSGDRKSVKVDQKGLYYILRSYVIAGGDLIHDGAPWMPAGYNSFSPYYNDWMRYIFDIDKIMTGRKRFKLDKVGITTSGVRVSVHYKNVPKLVGVNITDPDEQSLAQSIANLSLNPQDNDGLLGNNPAGHGDAHNNDVDEEQVENNNIGEEHMNVQVMENMVDDHANNELEDEAVGGNFVDVGHDPIVRLHLNGMFFFCALFYIIFFLIG